MGQMVLHSGPEEWILAGAYIRAGQGEDCVSNQQRAAVRVQPGPFGLCSAPATFSRLMDRVLAGLHWETCLFYLDDIIVFSSTWEEHLARLREVFERLRHAKLKLGPRNVLSPPKRSVIWVIG